MKRKLGSLLGLCVFVSVGGCAMCNNDYDDAYNAYGGGLERQDRYHGRVGSVLSDPMIQAVEPGALSDTPTEADLYPPGLLEGPVLDNEQP
ncbi:MAG: hypothetical protein ACYC3X_09670 [Pirellulaceae bacterium]